MSRETTRATPGDETPRAKEKRPMTPEEFASQFFQDTGERKSTNWTRLRDEVAARDASYAAREATLREALADWASYGAAKNGEPFCGECDLRVSECDQATFPCRGRRSRALSAPGTPPENKST